MWPASVGKTWDVARWLKKLPTPDLNRGFTIDFSQPQVSPYPPQKNLETTVHLWVEQPFFLLFRMRYYVTPSTLNTE
jgi:hypothetical protein